MTPSLVMVQPVAPAPERERETVSPTSSSVATTTGAALSPLAASSAMYTVLGSTTGGSLALVTVTVMSASVKRLLSMARTTSE